MFFEKGDRIAPTQIEQMRNGQYKILGYYDPSPHKKEIDWINRRDQSRWIGGKAPLDETLIKPRLRTLEPFLFWSMVSLAGFGIALSICCFVFNFLHRMRRYVIHANGKVVSLCNLSFCYSLIQMSHPNINNLMLVGIVLCLVTVVLLGLDGESIPNSWYSMLCQVCMQWVAPSENSWFVINPLNFATQNVLAVQLTTSRNSSRNSAQKFGTLNRAYGSWMIMKVQEYFRFKNTSTPFWKS